MKPPRVVEGWVEVYKTGIEYEANLIKSRLVDAGIRAVVLNQRDRSFSVQHAALARIYVMVSPEDADDALGLLRSAPLSDDELAEAALQANPTTPPAGDNT